MKIDEMKQKPLEFTWKYEALIPYNLITISYRIK
jgi:hypothetical protein